MNVYDGRQQDVIEDYEEGCKISIETGVVVLQLFDQRLITYSGSSLRFDIRYTVDSTLIYHSWVYKRGFRQIPDSNKLRKATVVRPTQWDKAQIFRTELHTTVSFVSSEDQASEYSIHNVIKYDDRTCVLGWSSFIVFIAHAHNGIVPFAFQGTVTLHRTSPEVRLDMTFGVGIAVDSTLMERDSYDGLLGLSPQYSA